jgi:hypothetical protein
VTARKPDPGAADAQQVAFIAGTSWSGSTLLEQGLAQLDGWVSVGEPFWIWDPAFPLMHCECGAEFGRCEFWQTVLHEAYGRERHVVREQVRVQARGLWRHSILPTLAHADAVRPSHALGELGDLVTPLYDTVARLSGATTVVDASKSGLWGLALASASRIDLRVIHLVRDPESFLASDGRTREVPYPPGATRPPRPPSRSLLTWLLLHFEADLLSRHDTNSTTVLYEDLVHDPAATAGSVARAIEPTADVRRVFDGDRLLVRTTGHAIGGNPRRPGPGPTVITDEHPREEPDLPPLPRAVLMPLARSRYRRYSSRAHRRAVRDGRRRSGQTSSGTS